MSFVFSDRRVVVCGGKVYYDLLEEAQKRKGGFGAVKTVRQPLPMCKAEVATCYEHRADELGCVNPEFFELPRGKPSFRVVEQQPSDEPA